MRWSDNVSPLPFIFFELLAEEAGNPRVSGFGWFAGLTYIAGNLLTRQQIDNLGLTLSSSTRTIQQCCLALTHASACCCLNVAFA